LAGKRGGPTQAPWSFRWILALIFFAIIPAAAALAAVIGASGEAKWTERFLAGWLTYTPMMWGLIMGPWQGRRLAAVVGYPQQVIGRVVELAIAVACFVACGLALLALFPGNYGMLFGPLMGGGLFVAIGVAEFMRRLGGR